MLSKHHQDPQPPTRPCSIVEEVRCRTGVRAAGTIENRRDHFSRSAELHVVEQLPTVLPQGWQLRRLLFVCVHSTADLIYLHRSCQVKHSDTPS